MADKRISQLIERTDIANNDVLPIVASAAITTNKVTVSTLQDWMQDNLDLGVTSVGITVGSSGTDINVTGSPITTSGNITINIPTASATNRGLLSSADWTTFNNKQDAGNFVTIDTIQTVTGQKTFNSLRINSSNGIIFTQQGGHGIPEIGNTMTTAIANDYRFIFGLGSANYKSFSFVSTSLSNNVNRALVVPDASGTIALTSDLGDFVTLSTAQTITATKTFSNSGSASNIIVNHTSGSGIALDITKGGNGEGIRVNKTGGSGNAATIIGTLEATTLVKTGGTASQFLKADGSIDSNSYIPSITAAPFVIPIIDNDGNLIGTNIGINNANNTIVGTSGLSIDSRNDVPLVLRTNDSERMRITSAGNVGIGTTSPSVITGFTYPSSFLMTTVRGSENSQFNIVAGSGSPRLLFSAEGAASNLKNWILQATTSGQFLFRSANDEQSTTTRIAIESNGDVGIGTASPNTRLDVSGNHVGSIGLLRLTSSTTSEVTAQSYYQSSEYRAATFVDASSNFNIWTRGSSSLIFSTSDTITERMRITSTGNVGIGTANPTRKLVVEHSAISLNEIVRINNTANNSSNDIAFVSILGSNAANTNSYHYIALTGAADQLYIYGNGNVVNTNNSYGALSDIKLKENITDASPKLDDLLKVKVRNFNYIGNEKKQIGVIAQELEEVFPAMIDESEDFEEVEVPQLDEEGNEVLNEEGEVVTTKERVSKGTTTKSVKYSVFVPMLIKAIQELKAEIDSLKNQIK